MALDLFLIFASCVFSFSALGPTCAQPATTEKPLPVVGNCSSQASILQAQEDCFTREGIPWKPPSSKDISAIKQSFLGAFSDLYDRQNVCRSLSRYLRATVCSLQVELQCQPRENWDYFPSPENMKTMLAVLCNNTSVIDATCEKSVAPVLFDSIDSKMQTYVKEKGKSVTFKNIICYHYAATMEALREVFPTCGCRMTKFYMEIGKSYANPAGCNPITVRTPECRPGTDEFMGSSAIILQRMSLPALCVLVLCAVYPTA